MDNPPGYDETPNEIWQPTVFILADTNIYAESTLSAPLYCLSRPVARLTTSTKEVGFERVEHTVKTKSDEPVVKPRSRQIYTIKYLTEIPGGLGAKVNGWENPQVYIQSVSRRTMECHLGIKRSRLRPKKSPLKVMPIELAKKGTNYGLPSFKKDAKPLFQIQSKEDGADWLDGDGNVVAVEEWSNDEQHKLKVTASLHRETIDALVAVWCGRMWQRSDENVKRLDGGVDGVLRRFRLAKEIQPTSRTMAGYGV